MIYTMDHLAFQCLTPATLEQLRSIAAAMQERFHDLASGLLGKPQGPDLVKEAHFVVEQLHLFALQQGYEQFVTALPGSFVLMYPVVLVSPQRGMIAMVYPDTPPHTAAMRYGWIAAVRPRPPEAS